MKKLLWLVPVVFLISCGRDISHLENKARRELGSSIGGKRLSELKGPMVVENDSNSIVFAWYKELEFSDTALFFVKLTSRDGRNYKIKGVGRNYQSAYLEGPMSKFKDLFPDEIAEKYDSTVQISALPDSINSGRRFILEPERLLHYIKGGYFEVLEKSDKYSIIDFYQVIAEITQLPDSSKIPTGAAKIMFHDNNSISILPIREPDRQNTFVKK